MRVKAPGRQRQIGPEPVDIHVAMRVRERRIESGLTQSDVAAELGITFQQLYKYEKAVTRISAARLYGLSKALGVPVTFFLRASRRGSRRGSPSGTPTADERPSFLYRASSRSAQIIDATSSPREEFDSPRFRREKVQANTENGNRLLGAAFDCFGVPFESSMSRRTCRLGMCTRSFSKRVADIMLSTEPLSDFRAASSSAARSDGALPITPDFARTTHVA
jgi:transcriptional regulator with XRE-family HTH domain